MPVEQADRGRRAAGSSRTTTPKRSTATDPAEDGRAPSQSQSRTDAAAARGHPRPASNSSARSTPAERSRRRAARRSRSPTRISSGRIGPRSTPGVRDHGASASVRAADDVLRRTGRPAGSRHAGRPGDRGWSTVDGPRPIARPPSLDGLMRSSTTFGYTPMNSIAATTGTTRGELAREHVAQRPVLARWPAPGTSAGTPRACRSRPARRRSPRARRGRRFVGERAEDDEELADEVVQPGQADRGERGDQERRRDPRA